MPSDMFNPTTFFCVDIRRCGIISANETTLQPSCISACISLQIGGCRFFVSVIFGFSLKIFNIFFIVAYDSLHPLHLNFSG